LYRPTCPHHRNGTAEESDSFVVHHLATTVHSRLRSQGCGVPAQSSVLFPKVDQRAE
jgi:hypothetical protein